MSAAECERIASIIHDVFVLSPWINAHDVYALARAHRQQASSLARVSARSPTAKIWPRAWPVPAHTTPTVTSVLSRFRRLLRISRTRVTRGLRRGGWHVQCFRMVGHMNSLPYEVKRAHWRGTWHAIRKFRAQATKIGQPMLRELTPARFDILYVAWRADWRDHERRRQLGLPIVERAVPMADLRRLLGLAGSTISRTVHRLQELGYVRVIPAETDRRAVVVVLTWRGARLLRMGVQCVLQRNGMRDCIVQHVMTHDGIASDAPRAHERMLASLGAHVDRWRSYARFFWCEATPIYDPRFVTYLRPHAASMLTGWGGR